MPDEAEPRRTRRGVAKRRSSRSSASAWGSARRRPERQRTSAAAGIDYGGSGRPAEPQRSATTSVGALRREGRGHPSLLSSVPGFRWRIDLPKHTVRPPSAHEPRRAPIPPRPAAFEVPHTATRRFAPSEVRYNGDLRRTVTPSAPSPRASGARGCRHPSSTPASTLEAETRLGPSRGTRRWRAGDPTAARSRSFDEHGAPHYPAGYPRGRARGRTDSSHYVLWGRCCSTPRHRR